jgi:FMNH2-dependent dimethyl sulfone monooxygenase
VQPNDGFKTGLIGTAEQIRECIRALEAVGVDLILCGFIDFLEEPALFGASVIKPTLIPAPSQSTVLAMEPTQ